jgi:hypothetical protein
LIKLLAGGGSAAGGDWEQKTGGKPMRKLVILGVALALGAVTPLVSQAQAAPAQSPYCNMPFKKWSTNWQQYYHCFGTPEPQVTRTMQRERGGPAKNPMCNVGFEKWNMGWQQYYHCFGS